MRRQIDGFNLVEILITLTLIALLTTTLIGFVNDFDDRTKVARARSDLMRLSQQAAYAESKAGLQIATGSAATSSIMTLLRDFIVEIPDYDPWGNRYVVSNNGTVVRSGTAGVAYIVDPSFGRMICAGPDGFVNTQLGSGVSDRDNDIVVEFRRQPWVAYSYTPNGGSIGEIWIARVDGTRQGRVMPNPKFDAGGTGVVNVTFSPDGSRWCGVESPSGGRLLCGNTTPENPAVQDVSTFTQLSTGGGSMSLANNTYPLFFPDGNQVIWINTDGSLRLANLIGETRTILLPLGSMNQDTDTDLTDSISRILHVSKERSYYWRPNGGDGQLSISIAVSADGKVAVNYYPAPDASGIYLLLPGSNAQRLLKKASDISDSTFNWAPLFWEDTNDLIYWGKAPANQSRFRRIAQDGRFDIPLHPDSAALSTLDPVVPSISPDGDRMTFLYTGSNDAKVLRTDGGGFVKGSRGQFRMTGVVATQEALWKRDGTGFYLMAPHGGSSGIQEVLYGFDTPSLDMSIAAPPGNDDFNITPARAAMSAIDLLIAVVESPDHGSDEDGVFLYPVLGPQSARVTISTTAAAASGSNPNRPNVVWVEN